MSLRTFAFPFDPYDGVWEFAEVPALVGVELELAAFDLSIRGLSRNDEPDTSAACVLETKRIRFCPVTNAGTCSVTRRRSAAFA